MMHFFPMTFLIDDDPGDGSIRFEGL